MSRQRNKRDKKNAEFVPLLLVVVAVWLGWQILREPFAQRLPPALALSLAPDSPGVLQRSGDIAIQAGDIDQAESLARRSLALAPFNARALRVVGLAQARRGNEERANEILTLAGNWSLRDDPAHAWLMEYRLKRGDYASSFAHADTLIRRRVDLQPQVFELFKIATTEDPRAVMPLARLVALDPEWRPAYLRFLQRDIAGIGSASNLAIALEEQRAGLRDDELSNLYSKLLAEGRIPTIRSLSRRIGRPASGGLVNGQFNTLSKLVPFEWMLRTHPGLYIDILTDEMRTDETALRVSYAGDDALWVVEQYLLLDPGRYDFSGQARAGTGGGAERFSWRLLCAESSAILAESPEPSAATQWTLFRSQLEVPPERCTAQVLQLYAGQVDDRSPSIVWYDNLAIRPVAPGARKSALGSSRP